MVLVNILALAIAYGWAVFASDTLDSSYSTGLSRLEKIESMYAWEGFVYDIESCRSTYEMTQDFNEMKARGARVVITFEFCGTGADVGYYDDVITAAGNAEISIIPLAWTLPIHAVGQSYGPNDTFLIKSVPRIEAVTQAVINNPKPVLAIAIGDEPLYDDDAGSPAALASYINQVRHNLSIAGLDIPLSISDLAYGWQSSGSITPVADAVDFFMVNNFPYFAFDATTGGNASSSWNDFIQDIEYFQSIANGRPILVTQTGWPTNEDEFAPNSPDIVASVPSSEGYWNLLDSFCQDYFKSMNIGWMWRSWEDDIDGWGVKYLNGSDKWHWNARTEC
ncbi:MAG: glycoside hydrolase [Lentinula lateritia]|uniref:glucan endo-1,3-beta-D-glucosidase n=1 Tax=Lentinula lateritia TaxID=40482 RepID=A0ABQ8V040_9AGAR|nr:MAG: glycoside hydrolase [Lentinula lateritia]KAJ4467342.1 glycoside hydrolase superfamily [Lentinula lateritia]